MSPRTHEAMQVRRIETATGSHIEPALEQSWSKLDKLRWKAGTVADTTGLRISIQTGAHSVKGISGRRIVPGSYTVGYGSGMVGPLSYRDAWKLLEGLEIGAEIMAQRLGARQCWACRRWHVDPSIRCTRCLYDGGRRG